MLFPHLSACKGVFRNPVGNAVPPASFNGLANRTATLGSFPWPGFETSGLSPDKKRLAWLGAPQRCGSGYRERTSDSGLGVEITGVMSTQGR